MISVKQVQKKNYREEKKRATKELLSTITDPSVIVMADWLKVSLYGLEFRLLGIYQLAQEGPECTCLKPARQKNSRVIFFTDEEAINCIPEGLCSDLNGEQEP